MKKTVKLIPMFVLCAAIVLAPGCGKKVKKCQDPKKELTMLDMSPISDESGPRFVFDDDIEAFVLDDNTDNNTNSQLAYGTSQEQALDFEWDSLQKAEQVATVYFPYDGKSPLANQAENMEKIDQLASAIYEKGETVCLKGHACKWHGTSAYNLALSQERASAIEKHLTEELHIPKSHIKTFGVGNEEPVAFEMTKEGQAPNRRVEIYGLKA